MTGRATSVLVGLMLAGTVGYVAIGDDLGSEEPWGRTSDPRIASTDRAEVCGFVDGLSYSRRHRALLTEEDRREDFARAGVPWSQHTKMEDDHLIPLDIGGADVPANRHPQPWPEARKKDRLEIHAGREVCAGRVPLATAQGWFLGDWRAAYRQQFGEEP